MSSGNLIAFLYAFSSIFDMIGSSVLLLVPFGFIFLSLLYTQLRRTYDLVGYEQFLVLLIPSIGTTILLIQTEPAFPNSLIYPVSAFIVLYILSAISFKFSDYILAQLDEDESTVQTNKRYSKHADKRNKTRRTNRNTKEYQSRQRQETQQEQEKRAENQKHQSAHTESDYEPKQEKSKAPQGKSADELRHAQTLGLTGKVSFADIQNRYRELAAKNHPDKVNHLDPEFQDLARKKIQAINAAYAFFKERYNKK